MTTHLFVNLPVADVQRSLAFFLALGYPRNPRFTDDSGACIAISETVSVMLLSHARFRDFTPKAICDTGLAVEVLLTLACESREQVDGLVAKALAAGGSTHDKPEDFGFMYTHSFLDLDGHGWGLVHMNTPQPDAPSSTAQHPSIAGTEPLQAAYAAFNARDIDAALAVMTTDVAWPMAFKGGFVQGHDQVRAYWTEQWSEIDPRVEPVAFHDEGDGRIMVDVHQIVRSLAGGEVIADQHVRHRFTMAHGLIQSMEVC